MKDRDAAFGVFVEITSYSHSNRIRTVTQDNYYFPGVEDERLHQTTQGILFSFYHGFPPGCLAYYTLQRSNEALI